MWKAEKYSIFIIFYIVWEIKENKSAFIEDASDDTMCVYWCNKSLKVPTLYIGEEWDDCKKKIWVKRDEINLNICVHDNIKAYNIFERYPLYQVYNSNIMKGNWNFILLFNRIYNIIAGMNLCIIYKE